MGRGGDVSFPRWAMTVGAMLDHGCKVAARCQWCRSWREIKLAPIVEAKGRDFSLVNLRVRCRLTKHCPGWNCFHYQHNVMLPLYDDATTQIWIEQDRAERTRRGELMTAAKGRLGRMRDRLADDAVVDEESGLSASDLDVILGRRIPPLPFPPGYVQNACKAPPSDGPLPAEPPLGVDRWAWNNAPDERARRQLIRQARG